MALSCCEKKLSALLRGIKSNHNGDLYCLKMPEEENEILKYNPGEKSLKAPFMMYAELECLLGKTDTFQNDPKTQKESWAYAFGLLMDDMLFI